MKNQRHCENPHFSKFTYLLAPKDKFWEPLKKLEIQVSSKCLKLDIQTAKK